ncbi:MAG: hypothetical protein GX213_08365 [Clostridiaceae bacterium]|nr:hypothetical protein [Clostridiaceae bacterium]
MEIFYICIILVGIFLVCFALLWMVVEKKKARDYRLDIDERRYELQQIIEDADQLLTELNNFSSYIVNRLEEKQQSIEEFINKVDEKIELFNQIEGRADMISQVESIEEPAPETVDTSEEDYINALHEQKGKLITLDERKREIIKLYKKGISSTEIARMLNMGKGEIELISRMCK